MNTKEKIKIMQAYDDGKEIECSYKKKNDWDINMSPSWNWADFDYRIKPEPKKRPITPQELFERGATHVRLDDDDITIGAFSLNNIRLFGMWFNTNEMNERCAKWTADRKTWHDFEIEEQGE